MTADELETWRTNHGDVVEVYRAGDGFRYRVKNRGNGEKVEQGSEAYTRKVDAVEAATRHHPVIYDLTEDQQAALEDAIGQVTEQMLEQADEAQRDATGSES